ncbi:unnamed protein product, partial [Staurois parvus]
ASQWCLSVPPISAPYQCHQCLLISAHQCCLSVPITAASLAHISEGEKITYLQNVITETKKKLFFQHFQLFLVCLATNKKPRGDQ